MRVLKYGLLTISFILLPYFARPVHACQCLQSRPPCAAYWEADAVFAGLVTNVSPNDEEHKAGNYSGERKVTFSLINAYRGVHGKEVEIQSTMSSCEYEFEKGKRYFVYAYRNASNNKLGTYACSRTTRLSNATEDMAFISSLSGSATGSLILGVISEDNYTPVKKVRVIARGNKNWYETSTDDNGRFRIAVPNSGKYTVHIVLPPSAYVVGLEHQLEQISRSSTDADQTTLEYDINVGAGKCAFIDVPVSIIIDSP